MCRLHRTPALHRALIDVKAGRVVWHGGRTGAADGYYWAAMRPGDNEAAMPAVEIAALYTLRYAGLIGLDAPSTHHWKAQAVVTTSDGIHQLSEWDS